MQSTWIKVSIIVLVAVGLSGALACAWGEEGHAEESLGSPAPYRLGAFRAWMFRSFLQDPGDDANILGLEFESYLNFGQYEVKNIAYFEVDQYPRPVPGQPPGSTETVSGAADGINDLLTAFLISKRQAHHGNHHFAPGFAMQFPTATNKTLGSGKWSIGPSVDYEYENGNLFAGAIALQIWSFAGDAERKKVNMLMIKPFVVYGIAKQWDLLYMPYGISVYWDKPSGEKVYFPLGGGVQRHVPFDSLEMNLALQVFKNVVRPTTGTVYDLRFLVELAF